MANVAGIVLAAGRSSRLGRPKQLLELDGAPIIRIVAGAALASSLSDVVLVLGFEADLVAQAVVTLPVRLVINPDYASGQSTSVRAGIRAIDDTCDAALVLLGDQPEVETGTIDALIAAFERDHTPIVQASYTGIPANPVLFSRALFPELLALTGDTGARPIVQRRAAERTLVELAHARPPADVDTEEDLSALLARWSARPRG